MTKVLETIYLESAKGNIPQYVPIQALRTVENYFQIAADPATNHIGFYKEGDTVRCAWKYFGKGFEGGIVVISYSNNELPEFSVGDRVWVSEHAGWLNNFLGTVTSGPEATNTRLGTSALYWVDCEEAQKERSEEDKYIRAQISNVYLELA